MRMTRADGYKEAAHREPEIRDVPDDPTALPTWFGGANPARLSLNGQYRRVETVK
jgi:hypothetical protein